MDDLLNSFCYLQLQGEAMVDVERSEKHVRSCSQFQAQVPGLSEKFGESHISRGKFPKQAFLTVHY